jgi:hypothetical protein
LHGVDSVGVQGEPVPELPEPGFLLFGQDPVGHGVGDCLFTACFESLVDGDAVPVGVPGYLGER